MFYYRDIIVGGFPFGSEHFHRSTVNTSAAIAAVRTSQIKRYICILIHKFLAQKSVVKNFIRVINQVVDFVNVDFRTEGQLIVIITQID